MDFHSIQPLEYGPPPTRCGGGGGDQTTMCLLLGGVAVVVYLMMQQQQRHETMHHPRFFYEQALQAPGAFVQGISSMIAQVGGAGNAGTMDASKKLPVPKDVAEIIDAKPEGTDNVEATRNMTDEEKQANEATLRSWLAKKSNDKACIVLFAHWCPHCKDMILEMVKTALVHKKTCKFLLVNAESIAPSAFTGDDKIFSLQFYPTVLCKTGAKLEQVESPKVAVKKLAEETDEKTKDSSEETAAPPVNENEDKPPKESASVETEEEMLSKFF